MCTPRKPEFTSQSQPARVAARVPGSGRSAPRPAHCRWIDDEGHEWVFTRDGGTLLVERPARAESVTIGFSDLSPRGSRLSHGEAWVRFRTSDGHLFQCSVCCAVGVMGIGGGRRPSGDVRDLNRHVRTFLEADDFAGQLLPSAGGPVEAESGR